jgi:hypothetical protein
MTQLLVEPQAKRDIHQIYHWYKLDASQTVAGMLVLRFSGGHAVASDHAQV